MIQKPGEHLLHEQHPAVRLRYGAPRQLLCVRGLRGGYQQELGDQRTGTCHLYLSIYPISPGHSQEG